MNKSLIKSIGAIIAGMVTGAVLSVATDFLLEKTGAFPAPEPGLFRWWMLTIALIYRGLYTIISGYVTAYFAPDKPLKHAIILGSIGVAVTILGSIANWEKSASWYPVMLILITLPCCWIGGKAYIKHKKSKISIINF